MVGSRVSLLVLGLAAMAMAQAPGEVPGCETTCRQAMAVDQAVGLGCAANDAVCLCKNTEFHNGIKDCVTKSCAPVIADQVIADINNKFCIAAVPTPSPTPSPSPPPAPVTTPIVSPTPPPVQTTPPVSTTPPAVQTPITSPASSSVTTPAPASSSSTSSPSLPATSSPASTGTKSPTTPTTSPVPTKSAAPEETGLSTGAKIGLGIGGAVALVGLTGLLACFYFLRRRGAGRNTLSMNISDPLPGSGRIFAKDLPAQRPFRTDLGGMTELELRSHPYEKMVPDREPRTMV